MTNFIKKSLYMNMKQQRDLFCSDLIKLEENIDKLLTKIDRQIETGNTSGARVLICHVKDLYKKGELCQLK